MTRVVSRVLHMVLRSRAVCHLQNNGPDFRNTSPISQTRASSSCGLQHVLRPWTKQSFLSSSPFHQCLAGLPVKRCWDGRKSFVQALQLEKQHMQYTQDCFDPLRKQYSTLVDKASCSMQSMTQLWKPGRSCPEWPRQQDCHCGRGMRLPDKESQRPPPAKSAKKRWHPLSHRDKFA